MIYHHSKLNNNSVRSRVLEMGLEYNSVNVPEGDSPSWKCQIWFGSPVRFNNCIRVPDAVMAKGELASEILSNAVKHRSSHGQNRTIVRVVVFTWRSLENPIFGNTGVAGDEIRPFSQGAFEPN